MKSFFLRLGIALAIQTVFIGLMYYFNQEDNRIINGICTIISMVGSYVIVEKCLKKNLQDKI